MHSDIPEFESGAEEAEFWDNNDVTELFKEKYEHGDKEKAHESVCREGHNQQEGLENAG
jgi:hypothetical protein